MSIAEKFEVIADEVYEKGISDERYRFWKSITDNGNRTNYSYAFMYGWSQDEFDCPPELFKPLTLEQAFVYNEIKKIDIDTSACTTLNHAFFRSGAYEIGVVDCRNATSLYRLFCMDSNLTAVQKVIVKEENTYGQTFEWCDKIEHIIFEGTIGQNGFDISMHTRLDHESLMSIINCLKDYSDSEETYKITFGSGNLAKLTDEEIGIIETKGWDYA